MDRRPPDYRQRDSLVQLDETKVQFLWSMGWWDGPLNGLALYEVRKCWFDINCPEDDDVHYHYILFPRSDSQADEAEIWHRTKRTYDGKRSLWVGRDESLHNENWLGPELTTTAPLGWFVDGKNSDFYAIKIYPSKT